MFFGFVGDGLQLFIQPLLEQVVLHVQLLLPGYIHGVDAEV